MPTDPSEKPLSPWWRHAVILVMAFGFSVLTMVTVLTYTNAPPIPERVTDTTGATLFTRENVEHGQEVFLKYGLMEHGTLWGHGAYLGPDYSAEYLHRLAEITRDSAGPGAARPRLRRARRRTRPRASTPASTACSRRTATTRPPAPCGFSPAEATAWKTQEGGVGRVLLGRRRRRRGCPRSTSATRASSRTSTRTSPGPRGRRSPTGPARTTPTRTTGRTSRLSATGRARRPTSGARSAS